MDRDRLEDKAEGLWRKLSRSMWFWIALLVLVIALLAWGFGSASSHATASAEAEGVYFYSTTTDAEKLEFMERGKASVQSLLMYPETARWQDVRYVVGEAGRPNTCGLVDALNSDAQPTGYKRFITGGTPSLTVFERGPADFEDLWKALC